MEQFQIETAQNVGISQNAAHLGDRMLAFLIDTLVIVIYYVLAFWLLVLLNVDPADQWALSLVMLLPGFLYYLLLESLMDGQTLGKQAMQLRVVKLDGSKPSFASYFIRWMLRLLDVSISSGGVAVFTILLSGKGQRVGDIAAGTTVISEKKRIFLKDTLWRQLPEDYSPRFPQVTIFSDREMQTIKEVYEKARGKGDHKVVLSLSNKIVGLMDVKTDLKPMELVDAVISDYCYYTQER
ncbi:RDD family protein [Maribacter sp. 2307ULW6-5]|uniref:RDD family protein n=1 Tax=Maribacter sp. 2307ULW6-5 TaxID=3386275 RepID=UPI0039BCEE5D